MAAQNDLPDVKLDPAGLYKEDTFTDRRAGTLRRLTPVTVDGEVDASRPVLFSGQTQLLTPAGVLPLVFELEAETLQEALEQFPDGVKAAGVGLSHRGAGSGCLGGPRSRRRWEDQISLVYWRKSPAAIFAEAGPSASPHGRRKARFSLAVVSFKINKLLAHGAAQAGAARNVKHCVSVISGATFCPIEARLRARTTT